MSRTRCLYARCFSLLLVVGLLTSFLATSHAQAPKLEKPDQGAANDYALAANLQNNGKFALSADAWDEFLKKHPATTLTPKAQYYAGICYLQIKDHKKAANHFSICVKKWAESPEFAFLEDAYLNLGWSKYSLGQQAKKTDDAATEYAEAAAAFTDSLKKYPKGKYVDQCLYFLADALYLQGKTKDSVGAYSQLVKSFPESRLRADALYALGVAHEVLKQSEEAGAAYDLFIKEFADNALITEVQMRKAETVLQAGLAAEPEAAAAIFGKAATAFAEVAAVEGFAKADHAIFRQALCVLNQDEYLEAAKLYARVPNDFPKSDDAAAATLSAGQCYYRAGEFDDAMTWFDNVIANDPANAPEAAHWNCRIHLQNKEPAKAAALAKKVLPKAADSPHLFDLKLDQADAAYEIEGQREESLNLYLAIYQDHPEHAKAPAALYNAAYTAFVLGKHADGLKHAAEFVEKFDAHQLLPDAKYVAAECNLLTDEFAAAEAAYVELTTNHAEHADLENWQLRLGLAIYLQKKYAETVAHVSPLLSSFKAKSDLAEANFLIGASHFYTDKFPQAAKFLEAAIQAGAEPPRVDEALLLLSQSQHKLKKTNDAIKSVSRLIADFPKSVQLQPAHYWLGEYQFANGKFKDAITSYETVIEKWPAGDSAPYAYYSKGWSEMKTNNHPAATASFTALLDSFPEHKLASQAQFARGMSRRLAGKEKDAIADLSAFLESNPKQADKTNALFEKGMCESALKDYKAAITSFSTLLKDDPKCKVADSVLYELAWAHKDDGNNKQALGNFTRIVADYPESRFAAESHFHLGDDLFKQKKYKEAAAQFTEAKQQLAPRAKSDAAAAKLHEQAIYNLGLSQYLVDEFAKALAEFGEQTKAYAAGDLNPKGLYWLAKSHFGLNNFKEALPAFKAAQAACATLEGDDADDIKIQILLNGGHSAVELMEFETALELLQPLPTDFPETSSLADAHFEIGQAHKGLEKFDDAIASFEKAAAKSSGGIGARARYEIGEVYFVKKEYDTAIKQFQRVVFGYSNPSDDIKKWQAYAGYEAARCSEIRVNAAQGAARKKLIADAKEMYNYVVTKHPASKLAAQSKARLADLDKL